MNAIATPAIHSFNAVEVMVISSQALADAMALSAVVARIDAIECVNDLKVRCQAFVTGQDKDYERVSRCAHLAAGALLTYGEICIELQALPEVAIDRILATAYAVKERAFEHELAHISNNLAPSQVFYDDMISMSVFNGVHAPIDAERFEAPLPSSEALTSLNQRGEYVSQ
jgi:hypothetical protein